MLFFYFNKRVAEQVLTQFIKRMIPENNLELNNLFYWVSSSQPDKITLQMVKTILESGILIP